MRERADDAAVENRPGLAALRWRIGTWSDFVRRILADLPREAVQDGERTLTPLAALNVRAPDDPTVAIADACAVMADVLTFYQERIANEGFLRTALERRSVLELARAIGYELGAGVAASTWLAFSVDDTPAAAALPGTAPVAPPPPRTAPIARGSQVQSIPGPGQMPQTFETIDDLVARADWNELRPRRTQPQRLAFAGGAIRLVGEGGAEVAANRLWVSGTATQLSPGDLVLAVAGGASLAARLLAVEVEDEQKRTVLHLGAGAAPALPPLPAPADAPPATTGRIDLTPLPLDPATVAERILAEAWDEQGLQAFCAIQRWEPAEVARLAAGLLAERAASSQLVAFRQRLACFGNNAPPYASVRQLAAPNPTVLEGVLGLYSPTSLVQYRSLARKIAGSLVDEIVYWPAPDPDDWDANPRTVWQDARGASWRTSTGFDVFLERAVQRVTPGGWALLELGAARVALRITDVGDRTLNQFALTGRATGLALAPGAPGESGALLVRGTTAHVESEAVPLAPLPVLEPVEDRSGAAPRGASAIELERMVVGLSIGQPLILTGTTLDAGERPGAVRSEVVRLRAVVHRDGRTTLWFEERLRWRYVRATVTLTANVVRATHGQTVAREILGSGDGGAANQRFTLQKPPLTWVAAPTATGRESTLEVRVDDTRWDEVPSLHGAAPDARVYAIRVGDDGKASVVFGDGVGGARLPTGASNVVARYRSGLGLAGQVPAGSLSVLMSRPLGVRAVVNPVAADGGADPEPLERARANAPTGILTLGRVVSLRDYEDFARSFAGIGKAQAVPLWDGESELVHLTVAAADGTPVQRASALYESLTGALAESSGDLERVRVDGFRQRFFRLEATVVVEPRADGAAVLGSAAAALRDAFSFERRRFGQPVTSAEVVTAVQSVRGVVATNLVALVALDDSGADQGTGAASVLPAAGARLDAGAVVLADLLLLHPSGVELRAGGRP